MSQNREVTAQGCYRRRELNKIVSALLACESLLICGEPGIGKSYFLEQVAQAITKEGFTFIQLSKGTVKQIMLKIVEHLDLDTETLEGKKKTTYELMNDIVEECATNQTIFLVDDAQSYPPSVRIWLERLIMEANCPVLLTAIYPPARDIFLKLPRINLEPLRDKYIREIMIAKAQELDIVLSHAQLSKLQASAGGNPMLAGRVVKEYYLGLENQGLDHTQWIDGTPFLLAGLFCLLVIRYFARGTGNTSLYLLGSVLTIFVYVFRIVILSLPRKNKRLG